MIESLASWSYSSGKVALKVPFDILSSLRPELRIAFAHFVPCKVQADPTFVGWITFWQHRLTRLFIVHQPRTVADPRAEEDDMCGSIGMNSCLSLDALFVLFLILPQSFDRVAFYILNID